MSQSILLYIHNLIWRQRLTTSWKGHTVYTTTTWYGDYFAACSLYYFVHSLIYQKFKPRFIYTGSQNVLYVMYVLLCDVPYMSADEVFNSTKLSKLIHAAHIMSVYSVLGKNQ